MADLHDPNENNFLARTGQIEAKPQPKAAPVAEKEEE
jgi:hypothetical protein